MDKNSKIYIAGHRGLVGSSLLRRLHSEGYENIITRSRSELDLTRQRETEAFFESEKPEYVFLAAAKVGGILANDTYTADFLYENIMIAANVILSAHHSGVNKLLNLGSSCIYPKFAPQPMKEDSILTGQLEPTNEPYAIAKISAIKLCRYFNAQYGTEFLSVMPANLYGFNDNFNLETSHVLPALMRKFHLAKLLENNDIENIKRDLRKFPLGFQFSSILDFKNEDSIISVLDQLGVTGNYVKIWGAGDVYREFLYVDDLSDACIFIMNNCASKDVGEFINVGTGKDIKVKDLAVIIKEVAGFKGEIRHDLSRPDGTPKKLLDVSRIRKIGWEPKTGLEEGIRRTYNWYLREQHGSQ